VKARGDSRRKEGRRDYLDDDDRRCSRTIKAAQRKVMSKTCKRWSKTHMDPALGARFEVASDRRTNGDEDDARGVIDKNEDSSRTGMRGGEVSVGRYPFEQEIETVSGGEVA